MQKDWTLDDVRMTPEDQRKLEELQKARGQVLSDADLQAIAEAEIQSDEELRAIEAEEAEESAESFRVVNPIDLDPPNGFVN
jgi:hypothetical protein